MIDELAAIERLIHRWRNDPVAFCTDVFPENERPREWQPEVLQHAVEAPWLAIVACRKAGKTRLAAFLALWFLCTRANSLVITIAPVWLQVVQALWADIRHLWAVSKLLTIFPSWQVLQTEIQTHPLTPKWRAIGLASTDSANIEGRHPAAGQPTLAIIDEAFNVSDEFFTSLQGMLSEGDSKLVAIGRAGLPRGWYYRAFATERALWGYTKRVTADEIPRLQEKAEAERSRLGADDPSFRQQWMAEFTGADDGALIPVIYVERATKRRIEKAGEWPRVAALDVAGDSKPGTGGDENVLTLRHGPVVVKQIPWDGQDEMQTASRAVAEAKAFGASVLVIDTIGIGAGVRSRARELAGDRLRVFGFNGGSSATDDEQYENVKAEEVFYLRKRFADGDIAIPDDPVLIGQLTSWTTKFSSRGRTMIVDPSDSPDYADSLMMAFAADRIGDSMRGVNLPFLR